MRDEFPLSVKETLAKRVTFRCSNPGCRKATSGPQEDVEKSINIGVAAHITAASTNGPRYDPAMMNEVRRSASNGIWLCQVCAKLVDNDELRYSTQILVRWKTISEAAALRTLESAEDGHDDELMYLRLEQLMPDLLDEMRKDLIIQPLGREFVVLKRVWTYNGHGHEFNYFYEEHEALENKLLILQNYALIRETTCSNVKRFVLSESLARYLCA